MAAVSPSVPLPKGTPEYMAPAYYGCLNWAIGNEGIRKQFEDETGIKIPSAPRSALDKLIDEATGVYAEYFKKFKEWHDEKIWGDVE